MNKPDFPRNADGRVDESRLFIGCAGYIHDIKEADAQTDNAITCWMIPELVEAVRAEASDKRTSQEGEK